MRRCVRTLSGVRTAGGRRTGSSPGRCWS